MATSPNTSTLTTPKKKEESLLEKIGTLGRKKKQKEAIELQEEGKNAIESPTSPTVPDIGPEGYQLEENEERSMIEPNSRDEPKVKELMKLLLDWINDVLADDRIIVKDIEEDLFDGQILQKLIEAIIITLDCCEEQKLRAKCINFTAQPWKACTLSRTDKEEKLAGLRVEVAEVSQSELGQKQKLHVILDVINRILNLPELGSWTQQKWSVDSIHSKNLIAILHLLVALARHFRAPIRLPENVYVNMVVVQKRDGMLQPRRIAEEITGANEDVGGRFERDAFDTLFDHAPDKLNLVKKTLVTFVNKQLMKVNLEVTDIEKQFHDGVYLVLLMGLLEGYFVPLYNFHLTPEEFEQKVTSPKDEDRMANSVDPGSSLIRVYTVCPDLSDQKLRNITVHNVGFAFELMQDAGLPKPKSRAEDVVNLDLKCTLRVLYNIFTKYKDQSL